MLEGDGKFGIVKEKALKFCSSELEEFFFQQITVVDIITASVSETSVRKTFARFFKKPISGLSCFLETTAVNTYCSGQESTAVFPWYTTG